MQIYKYRPNYWSCSESVRKLLIYLEMPKPSYATTEEWDNWNHTFQNRHPVLYPIVENWLDTIQDLVMFPYDLYDSIRIYTKNRFSTRTHIIDTKLKSGEWHDTDKKILHGMFELLVDFVEIEKANMWIFHNPEKQIAKRKSRWLRWFEHRSIQDGIACLEWEINKFGVGGLPMHVGGLPMHARITSSAKEQLELYNWWKYIRPTRPDPYEVSGWNETKDALPSNIKTIGDNDTSLLYKTATNVSNLEQQWHNEDTDMLKRLIDIRCSLWT